MTGRPINPGDLQPGDRVRITDVREMVVDCVDVEGDYVGSASGGGESIVMDGFWNRTWELLDRPSEAAASEGEVATRPRPVWRNAIVSSANGWVWRVEFNTGTDPFQLVHHDRQFVIGSQRHAERVAARRLARINRLDRRHRSVVVGSQS